MGRTIAICNQKGGVGKSTTAVNVAAYVALSGKRTLLVDMDAQGNATTACGIQRKAIEKDMHDVLVSGVPIQDAILRTSIERFDVVPSTLDVAGTEPYLARADGAERVLQKAMANIRAEYEVILFDCPPSLGLLTVNALVAAESAIIPVQCEYLALEGLSSLVRSIMLIKQNLNPSLRISGIVLTMTDFRANLTREVADEVKQFFKELVFETTIPRNIRLAESPSFGKPICLYDPNSTGAIAYHLLAKELMLKELSGLA